MFPKLFVVMTCCVALFSSTYAQSNPTMPVGQPPNVALITVSSADPQGNVTIRGAAGAVFPLAQVYIRNLYTLQTVVTQASITGQFSATIYGAGNTPFWISPAQNVVAPALEAATSLPGGPGTIIYGAFPTRLSSGALPTTQILLDGNAADWERYGTAQIDEALSAFVNSGSVYWLLRDIPVDVQQIILQLQINDTSYDLAFQPQLNTQATVSMVANQVNLLGQVSYSYQYDDVLEVRLPLEALQAVLRTTQLNGLAIRQMRYLAGDGTLIAQKDYNPFALNQLNEQDGVVRGNVPFDAVEQFFTLSGRVGAGSGFWHAEGQLEKSALQPSDTLRASLNFQMQVPSFVTQLDHLELIGRVSLRPLTDRDGRMLYGAQAVTNGWSSVKTASGLPISQLVNEVPLGEVIVPTANIIMQDNMLLFGMDFNLDLPEQLPPATYIAVFEGFARLNDSEAVRWTDPLLFGEGEEVVSDVILATPLPIPFRIGEQPTQPIRQIWTLFYDAPSDGSRGIVSQQDQAWVGLSNHTRYDAPTYILPPRSAPNEPLSAYSLEPYILSMMGNRYDVTAAPTLPLLLPSGQLTVTITDPDGVVNQQGRSIIKQNQLSTGAIDDSTLWGTHAPMDAYQLTTLNPVLSAYTFEKYGTYQIELIGDVQDSWGNRYEGGGTYSVLIAEPLDITPQLLPGTPLQVGDSIPLGLQITPPMPAEARTHVRFYPIDGSDMVETIGEGQMNPYGVWVTDETVDFNQAGEYVIDYEVRYTNAQAQLWAGSLRSAGVVGQAMGETFVLHGGRGLVNDTNAPQQARYTADQISVRDGSNRVIYPPYFSGDVVWMPDTIGNTLSPTFQLQDRIGEYSDWLVNRSTDAETDALYASIWQDRLPLQMVGSTALADQLPSMMMDAQTQTAYGYVSYITPSTTLRQMVLGSSNTPIPSLLTLQDPLNQQIGAGGGGLQRNDYFFLFGGARVQNTELALDEILTYASFVVLTHPEDERGVRVLPPTRGASGGIDGGALFNFDAQPIELFFHPTVMRAGDVFIKDTPYQLIGQVAPPLNAQVEVKLISPSNQIYQVQARANAHGYIFLPNTGVLLDEVGVWRVQLQVIHEGETTIGQVAPPLPRGSVLGATNSEYQVYVADETSPTIGWGQVAQDSLIPIGALYNFVMFYPEGWTNIQATASVTLPNAIIEQKSATLFGGGFSYQFDPRQIVDLYPAYEGNNGRFSGASASDPVSITFFITGLDENGQSATATRQFMLWHNRLMTFQE